jgi:hypothetical protein
MALTGIASLVVQSWSSQEQYGKGTECNGERPSRENTETRLTKGSRVGGKVYWVVRALLAHLARSRHGRFGCRSNSNRTIIDIHHCSYQIIQFIHA